MKFWLIVIFILAAYSWLLGQATIKLQIIQSYLDEDGYHIQWLQARNERLERQLQRLRAGKASYYDYTLPGGWSSIGHRVCAARDWPRGTTLAVYANGRVVECLVTDYGPDASVHPDRIVDLSSYAFAQLAPLGRGVVEVTVERINN